MRLADCGLVAAQLKLSQGALPDTAIIPPRVLLPAPQSLDYVAGFYGALMAGVIPVTLPAPRSKRSVERVRRVAEDCTPVAMLVTQAQQAPLQKAIAEVHLLSDLPEVVLDGSELDPGTSTSVAASFMAEKGPAPTIADDSPNRVAFLQYTSGSTSQPKGVMVTHGNLAHNCAVIGTHWARDTRTVLLSWLPLHHDMGLIGCVLSVLHYGGQAVLLPPNAVLQRPLLWLEMVSRLRATDIIGPDFGYAACAQAAEKLGCPLMMNLSSLSTASNGAEPVRPETLERFGRTFDQHGFRREAWVPCYGMAETTLTVTAHALGNHPVVKSFDIAALARGIAGVGTSEGATRRLTGCGTAHEGMEIAIVNPETHDRLDDNQVGEIWVRGESVAAGYFGKPEITREIFGARISDGSGPWLRTGDLGFLHEGQLYPCGRVKDMIKLRGRNLYPQDIEAAVASQLPWLALNGCAVFGVDKHGAESIGVLIEADRALAKQLKAAPEAAARELVDLVRQAVTEECEAAPALIAFIGPTDFPRTTSGKVQRHAAKLIATTPGDSRVLYAATKHESGTNGPAKGTEQQAAPSLANFALVHEILLSVLRDQVDGTLSALDPDAPLTRYGMDSLATVEAAVRLERASGRKLPAELVVPTLTTREVTRLLADEALENSAVTAPPSPASTPFPQRMAEAMERFNRLREAGRYPYHQIMSGYDGGAVISKGKRMLMLGSYEYLNMVDHPLRVAAAKKALDDYGTGGKGVPILAGKTEIHVELEKRIAQIMQAEDAIVYTSGFVTNLATVCSFTGPGDVVIGDALNHASILDGCRNSGARFITYAHNDLAALERLLVENAGTHTLVVMEGVFSMDGDIGLVPEVAKLCKKHGAYLMVDEAHSFGVIGCKGLGVLEHFDLPPDAIDLKMGTLSKALAGVGGFVAGKGEIIDFLRHTSRGYVFSGALPPPNAAASLAALEVLETEPWRVERLQNNARRWRAGLQNLGYDTFTSETAIVPVRMPDERTAFEFAHRCKENGIFVVPIVFPAVPVNAPRMRTCVTTSLSEDDLDWALEVFANTGRELGVIA